MAAELGELRIVVTTDTLAAKAGLQGLNAEAEASRGFFATAGGAVAGFMGAFSTLYLVKAAFDVISNQVKGFIDASSQASLVTAQMNQALKSTNDASGETAQSLEALANGLSQTTLFSRDTVESAQNLLLTFTGIGKKVFPDATSAVLDMSQALGEDTKSAAIQLGKALNDPITGITALRRVGVSFTTDQKNMIKSMVESGNTIGAQKLILQELNREFGGSAEAAGKTLPGQLAILKNSFEDIRIKVGDAIIPLFTKLLDATHPLLIAFGEGLTGSLSFVADAIGRLSDFLTSSTGPMLDVGNALQTMAKQGEPVRALLTTTMLPALQSLLPVLETFGRTVGQSLVSAFTTLFPVITSIDKSLAGVLLPLFGTLLTAMGPVIHILGEVFATVVKQLSVILKSVGDSIQSTVMPALKQMEPQVLPIITTLGKWATQVGQVLIPTLQILGTILSVALPIAIDIIVKAFQVVFDVVSFIWPVISTVITDALNVVIAVFTFFADLFQGHWGKLWGDVLNVFKAVWGGVFDIIGTVVHTLITLWLNLFKTLGDIVSGGLTSLVNWWLTLPERIAVALMQLGPKLPGIAHGWMTSLGDAVTNGIPYILDALGRLRLAMLKEIGSLIKDAKTSLNGIPGLGGALSFAGFASGTVSAPGGPVVVGEGSEPELVVGPHLANVARGSGIFPLSQVGVNGGNSGTQYINIVLDGQVLTAAVVRNQPREVWLATGMRGHA